MKPARPIQFCAAALAAFHFAACSGVQVTHVAPGKSASKMLAERKRVDEALPAIPVTRPNARLAAGGQLPPDALPALPSGAAGVPLFNAGGGAGLDAYSRGTFAMQAGQVNEAITAFEEAVKLDPDYTDAWGKLAILYQKTGSSAKAMNAFKKAKRLGDANGGTASRNTADDLPFQ